jgi:hypothetical protein
MRAGKAPGFLHDCVRVQSLGRWVGVAARTPAISPFSIGEAREVVECAGDEPLSTGVLSLGGCGVLLDKIARACCRLGARRRGGGEEKNLQFFLATLQRGLVSLNIVKITADLGFSLSGHSAALVKVNQLVHHDRGPFARGVGRSLGGGSGALAEATAAFVLVDLGFLASRLPRL